MLNIKSRISISRASSRHISTLKTREGGVFTTGSWSSIRRSVKREISAKILANQGLKCVYCERYLIGMKHEIDHFAHKGDYPQFTFVPINLFYSCGFCNSSERKGQKNTIDVLEVNYRDCVFSIVHPYINEPEHEIRFTDGDRIYFDHPECSDLGKNTIEFFGWSDLLYSTIRSKTLVFERLNPLTSEKERELIQLAIAYK